MSWDRHVAGNPYSTGSRRRKQAVPEIRPRPAARGSWPVQKRPGGCRGAADSGTKAGKQALRLFFFLEFFLRLVRLRGGIGGIGGVGGGVAGIHGGLRLAAGGIGLGLGGG